MAYQDAPRRMCSFPAPQSASVESDDGKWFHRSWEKGEKRWYTANVLNRPLSPREQEEEDAYQAANRMETRVGTGLLPPAE